MPPVSLSRVAARRFARAAVGLAAPHADIGTALSHHGYIQIDPINVAGRMHDLILRNRVAGYREGDLMRFLHGAEGTPPLGRTERSAFEHHVPGTGILVAFPLVAWPHLLGEMHRRSRRSGPWSGRLTPREKELAEKLLAEIAARGPLGSEDFDDERRARSVWGAAKLAKATLQKLFFHGRILIAQRANNRRRYDLPERVLPRAILEQPEPPAAETARWLALLKLRQRRLCALKRDELRVVADAVQQITVEGCPPLYCLREDVPLLERAAANDKDTDSTPVLTRLLAPLDPLIYDRRVTLALWDFDYTWEVYTPPAKRVRGYYALPVLSGLELVGHVDPKADREAGRLRVISKRIRRGHRVADPVREFARWLGLR